MESVNAPKSDAEWQESKTAYSLCQDDNADKMELNVQLGYFLWVMHPRDAAVTPDTG